jgi:hypothetical protein
VISSDSTLPERSSAVTENVCGPTDEVSNGCRLATVPEQDSMPPASEHA